MTQCPLVSIEWEDSRQPIANWVQLSTLDQPTPIRCASVGWLIHDGADVKSVAANVGDLDDEGSAQASSIIQIPTRCILRTVQLDKPNLTSSSSSVASSGLASRPDREPTPPAF